ncbi:PilW family protein [Pseudomonas saudiphocaensis]|uniref:PilW family protein n=1 Tax=Pseudomonas saudiphocaensis TaxID=1499686 RepID=UPI00187D465D|nr:prepilin-type N-terminal cleavage/methylation domain-containing protein [Pseudomonas saudiphocaensis]MBE7929129.1 prepilin-type N-terminal cleavage/methylation domain-containing protein [Pseudomonas saudiphocaensis]
MNPKASQKQRGLSLVELMVAMALSSFLILGVTQIYLDNKRNYLYQQGQGENLENGRFALMLIGERLAKAGYRRNPALTMDVAFPSRTVDGCTFAAGQTVVRVDDSTLCLRYQPRDENETNCLGDTYSGSSDLSKPYDSDTTLPHFNTDDIMVEKIALADGALKCNSQELVSNIAGLHFDYGVNSDISLLKVNSYTTTPASDDIIRALRYSTLLVASTNNLTQGVESKVCSNPNNDDEVGDWEKLTGQTLTCEPGKLYQMVSSSSTLRNLMP